MKHSLDVRGGRAVAVTVAAWIAVATGCGSGISDGGLFAAGPDASADVQTREDTGSPSSGTGTSSSGTGIVGTSSGTGTGTGLPASSSSSTATGTPGTGTGTGKPTSGSGTGYDPTDPGAGDQPGSCVTATGAPPCTPGHVGCTATTSCPTPEVCCAKMSGGACVSSAGDCHGGAVLACEEAGDCPKGQACCGSLSQAGAATTCATLVNGMCPGGSMATISVQVCRSDNECPSSKCGIYNCQGNSIEACNNPSSMYCQAN